MFGLSYFLHSNSATHTFYLLLQIQKNIFVVFEELVLRKLLIISNYISKFKYTPVSVNFQTNKVQTKEK